MGAPANPPAGGASKIILEKWSEAHKKDPDSFFDKVLGFYKFPFLGNSKTYVESVWKDQSKREETQASAHLIYSPSLKKEEVLKHLAFRHPIHIGGPSYGSVDEAKMEGALFYKKIDAADVDVTNAKMRYGILAKTFIDRNIDSIPFDSAWILHAWGVNLESSSTTDGRYVFKSGSFDEDK